MKLTGNITPTPTTPTMLIVRTYRGQADTLAEQLVAASATEQDQVWRLPLWQGYRAEIDSKVADLKNIGNGPYGGAITAALHAYQDRGIGWMVRRTKVRGTVLAGWPSGMASVQMLAWVE